MIVPQSFLTRFVSQYGVTPAELVDPADKEKYLKNIKRNLERGGLLIAGDIFFYQAWLAKV